MASLQEIALQYQITERTGADVSLEVLLGDRPVAQLADLIAAAEDFDIHNLAQTEQPEVHS